MRLITLSTRIRGSIPLKLALYLTLARIVISPIFLLIYLNYQDLGLSTFMLPIILLGLLTLSELSDFFDGFIARKWNQVTDLGKILDPMADSIARISVFLTFTQGVIKLPLLLVLVFLYRDVVISMLRTLCALRGYTLAARTSGKIKAVIQAIAAFVILLMMIPHSMGYIPLEKLQNISFYVVAAAAVYTLFSGIEYIYANLSFIKQAWSKKP
jgi:CDP-diacylglycerol--glycerol-3-phosphate 3-phosphatidyltransferase